MKENYDTLMSLGMVPMTSEIISVIAGQGSPACNIQVSEFPVKVHAREVLSSCDRGEFICAGRFDNGEASSQRDPWDSLDQVKFAEVETKDCIEFVFSEDPSSMDQPMIEIREDLSAWNRQDSEDRVKMNGEDQSIRCFEDSLAQVNVTEGNGTIFGACEDAFEQVEIEAMEAMQKPSVWDVRDSKELVKIDWEVQTPRDLTHYLDRPKAIEGEHPPFTYFLHHIGQTNIEEREEMLTTNLEESSVGVGTKEGDGLFFRDCHVPVGQVNIEVNEVAPECDFRDSVNGTTEDEWPIGHFQDSFVEVEITEWVEPSARNLQDSTDQVKMDGVMASAGDVLGCEDPVKMDKVIASADDVIGWMERVKNIKEEKSSAIDFQDPMTQVNIKEGHCPSAKVLGTLDPVNIKKEKQSTNDFADFLDNLKTTEDKKLGFRQFQRCVVRIERNKQLCELARQALYGKVKTEECEDLFGVDLQGPIIMTEDELSVGAECVVASTPEIHPNDHYRKIKTERNAENLEPYEAVLGNIKEEAQLDLKWNYGNLLGDGQEYTNDCERTVSQNTNTILRTSVLEKKKTYKCNGCFKSYSRKDTLSLHMRMHEGEGPYLCNQCTKSFRKYCHLHEHQRSHKEKAEFICSICGMNSIDYLSLEMHIQEMHTRKPISTTIESGQLSSGTTAFATTDHVQTVRKLHVCSDCGKKYAKNPSLIGQQQIHKIEDPNACCVCGKGFNLKESISKYQKMYHHNFKCEECGDTFLWRTQLNAHQKAHEKKKYNMCKECGEGFTSYYALTKHQLIHAGENPFLCSECGESFRDTSSFLIHHKTHRTSQQSKSYRCLKCGKVFAYQLSLTKHLEMHGEMNNTCAGLGCG